MDLKSKEKLITYNSEDCQALQEIAGLVSQICSGTDSLDLLSEVVPADAVPEFNGIWRRFSSPITAFEAINKAAKWDYQRNKVYLRRDKDVRRVAAKPPSHPVTSRTSPTK